MHKPGRIRVTISFEVEGDARVHWPIEMIAAGIGTLIDEGKLPRTVEVWNERVRIDVVSAATLAKREREPRDA